MRVRDLYKTQYITPLRLGDTVQTPLVAGSMTVADDWIDYNGHMNERYYITAATQGFEALTQYIGMDVDFVQNTASYFTLENHNVYMQECRLGDGLTSVGQLLDCDEKCIHVYYDVYKGNVADGEVVFSMEQIKVLVDVTTRKATPLPQPMYDRLQAVHAAHKALPTPKNVGRNIQIRKKL